MTKGQIIQNLFVRFLMEMKFENCEFLEIWNSFVNNRKALNSKENFDFIYDYFRSFLEEEYFIMDNSCIPNKYTSAYHSYQLKKIILPSELQPAYESIYLKTQELRNEINKSKIKLDYLNECFKEFPAIQFQIEFLIERRQLELLKLESKVSVLNELIKTFN